MDTTRNVRHEYMLETIDKVFEHWASHPEMRLMQMLINACPHDDLFYIEDDKLLANLETMKGS